MADDCSSMTALIDWTKEDTEVPGGNAHLWEESWDDDDIDKDFATQLKYGVLYLGDGSWLAWCFS